MQLRWDYNGLEPSPAGMIVKLFSTKMESKLKTTNKILYSCYHQTSRDGEHFVADHALSYIVAGSMIFNDGDKSYTKDKGDLYLVRRNQLLKYTKFPPPDGQFRSLSIHFGQDALRNFSEEYRVKAKSPSHESLTSITTNDVLRNFVQSLLLYHENEGFNNAAIIDLNIKECLLLLLQYREELADVLFDFAEPGKIDLEGYMNKNYHFNVGLDRFAYLTGRSLATFKRDFEKVFHLSPHRWLLQKRLKEALFLIREKGKTSSEIYLDLGFEDLSHFSYVFKKQFGMSPTEVESVGY